MGSYGIGIERILSAAIELYHDKDGMSLPPAIAPFTVVVTPVNMADAAQKNRIALLQFQRTADRRGPFRANVVGQGTCALAAFAPHDVAEARLALALRP